MWRRKLQGQHMATARGPDPSCKVCAENKLGTQALLCHLLKRLSEGMLPPCPLFSHVPEEGELAMIRILPWGFPSKNQLLAT